MAIAVIVAVVVTVVAVAGCIFLYMRMRAAKKMAVAQIGRPALRRQPTSKEESGNAIDMPEARVDDVRLVELGMAVERTLALHRQSSGAGVSYEVPSLAAQVSNEDIAIRLDSVQATLDSMRGELSPRELKDSLSLRALRGSPRSPRAPARADEELVSLQTVDTRIRAASSLDDVI